MAESATAFPLDWPAWLPRAARRQRAAFRISQDKAMHFLIDELRKLGAKNVVISTNIELRRDGLPYARQKHIDNDPGVACYFEIGGEPRCIAVDRWDSVGANMQAIHLTIAALRGIERWGSEGMVSAAFTGFAALPAGDTTGKAWWEVLGVSGPDARREDIEYHYKVRARTFHPDTPGGGNPEAWIELNEAYEQAKQGASYDGQK